MKKPFAITSYKEIKEKKIGNASFRNMGVNRTKYYMLIMVWERGWEGYKWEHNLDVWNLLKITFKNIG